MSFSRLEFFLREKRNKKKLKLNLIDVYEECILGRFAPTTIVTAKQAATCEMSAMFKVSICTVPKFLR